MTEIEFEVREQDLLAFNEHRLTESPTLQKSVRRHQGMIPGIISLIALALWLVYQDTLSAVFAGLFAVAWGLAAPFFIKKSTLSKIKQLYTDADRAAALGKRTLRIGPKTLTEVTPSGESSLHWSEVLRVEMVKKYAFVFVDVDAALIIPRATITKGDLHEFVKEADACIEKASD